ncbi:hypothetical protein HPP92_012440 [Vanilla planifolia]|uniref:Uncharacterized protein n=1 Tax=Vanilla planifolia TaxID=51239 RepID=A0A835V147_VANPL|nr:hypothetical protein HPP92_012440 [Vanilla planifolia]
MAQPKLLPCSNISMLLLSCLASLFLLLKPLLRTLNNLAWALNSPSVFYADVGVSCDEEAHGEEVNCVFCLVQVWEGDQYLEKKEKDEETVDDEEEDEDEDSAPPLLALFVRSEWYWRFGLPSFRIMQKNRLGGPNKIDGHDERGSLTYMRIPYINGKENLNEIA